MISFKGRALPPRSVIPSGQSQSVIGVATGPAAGATICTTPGMPAGMYKLLCTFYVDGTALPVDADNMRARWTGFATQMAVIPSSAVVPVQYELVVILPAAGSVSVVTNAAATSTAVYHASLIITPITVNVP